MSKGDVNTYSVPTIYKGIQMRSKLETKIAYFLDFLKIKWIYEPQVFHLSSGIIYKPDFYLPEHKQWIEVKGVIGNNNLKISKTFVDDNDQELILISSNKIHYFEYMHNERGECWEQDGIQIGFCSHCRTNFFCSILGSYHCRKCKKHEGDHDIYAAINSECWGEKIDFSNSNSIKTWLEDNGKVC